MKKTFTLIAFMLLLIAAKAQPVIENGVLISWPNATGDIVIPDGVTKVGDYAFRTNWSITSVTMPSSLTSIGNFAFYHCWDLKSVVLSNSVLSIGASAFNDCENLESVVLSTSLISIGEYAFSNCGKLSSINLASTSLKTIGQFTFNMCVNLYISQLPNTLEEIGVDAFSSTKTVDELIVPLSVKKLANNSLPPSKKYVADVNSQYFSSEDGVLFNKDKTLIIAFPLGKTSYRIPSSVTSIERSTNFPTITDLFIPASVQKIEPGVFSESKIVNINVEASSSTFSSIDGILFNKQQSELICYPSGKTTTSYNVPEGIKIIMDRTFSRCISLINISLPNSLVTIGPAAFIYCEKLENINIPNSIKAISEWAFQGCNALKTIPMNSEITSIERYAYSSCKGITNVTVPNTVTKIGEAAFWMDKNLLSATLPEKLDTIQHYLFSSCDVLEKVTAKSKIVYLNFDAFFFSKDLLTIDLSEAVNLKNVNFKRGTSSTILTSKNFNPNLTIYVATEELKKIFEDKGFKVILKGIPQFKDFSYNASNTTVTYTATSFSSYGDINIKEQGIVLSSTEQPTINDCKITGSLNVLGSYTAIANNLQPNIVYHVRAYAITNEDKIFYSDEILVVIQPQGGLFPPTLSIDEKTIKVGSSISLVLQGDTQKIFDKATWEVNGKALPENTKWWQIESAGIFILKATSPDGKATIEKRIEVK